MTKHREDDSPESIRRSIDGDMLFHRKLLETTRNEMLQSFAMLIDSFFVSLKTRYSSIEDNRKAAEIHLMIVEALHDKNLSLAQGLMQQHLSRYTK
ncbi:MAG: FCD domain-containing protein [Victivallales bacterium]|jgi:DNA-binding FadR family transcriptional regulator|nr:FCD domain-containing protein [Victivallales bacterium]